MNISMKTVLRLASLACVLAILPAHAQQPELVVPVKRGMAQSGIPCLEFSPDGKFLAVGNDQINAPGSITLWDLRAGKPLRTLKGHAGNLSSFSFSPDGSTLASIGVEQRHTFAFTLWDISTGSARRTLKGQFPTDLSVVRYAGNLRVVFGSSDYLAACTGRGIEVLNVHTNEFLPAFEGRLPVFSPDETIIASIRDDKSIELRHVPQLAQPFLRFPEHTERINAMAFSPDGQMIASGGEDNTVQFWDVSTGTLLRTLKGHTDRIASVAFSPDGGLLASGSNDSTINLWNIRTGRLIQTFSGHTKGINAVDFSPGGNLLASGSFDGSVKFWDVEQGQELAAIMSLDKHDWAVVTPEQLFEASPGALPSMYWVIGLDPVEFDQLHDRYHVPALLAKRLGFNDEPLPDVSGFPDLRRDELTRIAPVSSSTTKRLKPELVIQSGHTREYLRAEFSPDGQLLATFVGEDQMVKLWDVGTGKELRTFRHDAIVNVIAFSPDSRTLASGDRNSVITLWDVKTGEKINMLTGSGEFMISLEFSPDGKVLASGNTHRTVKLWDVRTGRFLRTLSGHAGVVNALAFSPDGQYLASAGSFLGHGTVKLWEIRTGNHLYDVQEAANAVTFSPDGEALVTGSAASLTLWDIDTGRQLRSVQNQANSRQAVLFDPETSHLISAGDEAVKVWDIQAGRLLQTFPLKPGESFVSVSRDARTILTRSKDHDVFLRDARTGDLRTILTRPTDVRRFDVNRDGDAIAARRVYHSPGESLKVKIFDLHTGRMRSYADRGWMSPDFQIMAESVENTIQLADVQSGDVLHVLEGHSEQGGFMAFSPKGQLLASSSDNKITLWDVRKGKPLYTKKGYAPVVFNADGTILAARGSEDSIKLWDVSTRQLLRILIPRDTTELDTWDGAYPIRFSPDGSMIASSLGSRKIFLWNVNTGRLKHTFSGIGLALAFNSDGSILASGGGKSDRLTLWDTATGKRLHTLRGHTGNQILSVDFLADGRVFASGCESDPRILLWDANTGKQLAALILLDEHDWAVVTPDGQFDATPGAMKLMHVVVGLEPIELAQLKERYYEPGLLQKLLGFNEEPLREVPAFDTVELYPEMEWIDDDLTDETVRLRLMNRGGGIGRVAVFINGKEVTADARGAEAEPDAESLDVEIDLKDHPFLIPGGQNTIEVKAWNSDGYLVSRGLSLGGMVSEKQPEQDEEKDIQPHLWAIVTGISDYQGERIDLQFSAKDAESMAAALQLGAARLFGAEHVHLTLLTSPLLEFPTLDGQRAFLATRTNVIHAFETARQAKSTDVLVVYLAGHGVNHGGQDGDYYYLTADARSGNLDDPAVRARTTISSRELTELIKQIPALKQVLILDTCMSGRVIEKLTEQRNIPSSQIRALERMKDRMGLHILAGSAANAVSYEASRYGQGLLTYSLLMGMRGAALREGEYIDISRLFEFAADRVPDLAKDIGGIQRPVVATPRGGSSFDIGRLTSDEKPQIPLAKVRPLILQVNFQNEAPPFHDNLHLTKQINAALRERAAHGQDAPFVFVDAEEFPGAYMLAGRYRIVDDDVTVEVYLLRGQKTVGSFTVKGDLSDVELVTEKFVKTLEEEIEE